MKRQAFEPGACFAILTDFFLTERRLDAVK
jgi:hypothetical protein